MWRSPQRSLRHEATINTSRCHNLASSLPKTTHNPRQTVSMHCTVPESSYPWCWSQLTSWIANVCQTSVSVRYQQSITAVVSLWDSLISTQYGYNDRPLYVVPFQHQWLIEGCPSVLAWLGKVGYHGHDIAASPYDMHKPFNSKNGSSITYTFLLVEQCGVTP